MNMSINKKGGQAIANRYYLAVLVAFFPFMMLLMSGAVVLLYHVGAVADVLVLGVNKDTWMFSHRLIALINIPIISWHLTLHYDWFVRLFTRTLNNKHKNLNTALFIVFVLCIISGVLPWLVFETSSIGEVLRGLHSKLGLVLIIVFIFHLRNYLPWIIRMTKKFFSHSS